MGIILEGSPPYELVTQKEPNTTAQGETVVMTLPVFAAGFPGNTQDIQLRLTIEHAEYMASQIQAALVTARQNRRRDRH